MIDMFQSGFVSAVTMVTQGIVEKVPAIVVAVILLVLGLVFGSAAGKVVSHLVRSLKIDDVLDRAGISEAVAKSGYKLDVGSFLGWLVKAFFVVVFAIAAFDVLGLSAVNDFLSIVVGYIPKVIAAALILLVASIAADIVGGILAGATTAVGITAAHTLGVAARFAIWVFAFIAALFQVGIAREFMLTLFTGIVAMLALAGGLAFGLGGKDAAADFIKKLRTEMREGRKE